MDVLNIVFSVLNLLATVIIGVIQVTWMISKDVFRETPRKTLFLQQKRLTAKMLPQATVNLF